MASRVFRLAALDRLSSPEQLDQLVRITPPQGWAGLGLLACLSVAALAWALFGSITLAETVRGELVDLAGARGDALKPGRDLLAVFRLPAAQAQGIHAGAEADVLPEGLEPEDHGFLRGRVAQMVLLPAGQVGGPARRERQEDGRPSPGAALRIEVSLEPDPRAPSGYRWAASRGPDVALTGGTAVVGRIVVFRGPPLFLLLGGLSHRRIP